MEFTQIGKLAHEIGLSIAVFVMCFWIVRFILTAMVKTLTDLSTSFQKFSTKVEAEHCAHAEAHEAIMRQHREIMDGLGRINGYTGGRRRDDARDN